jgi:hypothetical protein
MMPVVMLGSDYKYSLSAYSRGPSTLGADIDWSGFWKGLGGALEKGMQYGIDYVKARQSQIDSTTFMKIIEDITSGKLTSAKANENAGMQQYLPWIIGGAAVLIALMFMVGTRRR